MNSELLNKYQILERKYQKISDSKSKLLKLISLLRLFTFIGIAPAWFYLGPINFITGISVSMFLLISFLFLVKKYIQTENELSYFQNLVEININEIRAINLDYSTFDDGKEFIDSNHDYSFDLDLYGPGSFFQFINRTVTLQGKKYLSTLLNTSYHEVDEIKNKQKAITELAKNLDWRQNLIAIGKDSVEHTNHSKIEEVISKTISLKHKESAKYLTFIFPFLILLCIVFYVSDLVTGQIFIIVFLTQSIIYLFFSKTISKFYVQFQSQANILNRYVGMLEQIENLPSESSYIIDLKSKLTDKNKTASTITNELQKILNEFDYRKNLFVAIVLNLIFLWDIRCVFKLYQWQQKYSGMLPKWIEVIAETDALISLANCNYNHPEWTIPILSHSEFHIKAENLGHPLIDIKRCVSNSFNIVNNEQMVIITGANMAGKSTFLRTVGINLILASNGCKVCASGFELSPIRIYTNMRTTDNLIKDESYFYAELLRIQKMLELIKKGEKLFVIVDEMLKGTNSIDKLNGSKELIKQLISLEAHGIVATHDLGLTELVNQYPNFIKNQCFEVNLQNDELSFDYKLTDGVTRTMNATFLMKKMGIIPNGIIN